MVTDGACVEEGGGGKSIGSVVIGLDFRCVLSGYSLELGLHCSIHSTFIKRLLFTFPLKKRVSIY